MAGITQGKAKAWSLFLGPHLAQRRLERRGQKGKNKMQERKMLKIPGEKIASCITNLHSPTRKMSLLQLKTKALDSGKWMCCAQTHKASYCGTGTWSKSTLTSSSFHDTPVWNGYWTYFSCFSHLSIRISWNYSRLCFHYNVSKVNFFLWQIPGQQLNGLKTPTLLSWPQQQGG